MSYILVEKFLDEAESLVETGGRGESLLEVLESAESLIPEDVSVLCRSARLLFRYGILNSKGRFFLLAQDKLKRAAEINPLFFDTHYVWWQLWGNILVQMGKLSSDGYLFELALEKFERASQACSGICADVYWDSAEAWILLAQKSGELPDFGQGLAQFHVAAEHIIPSPFFRLDYAQALCIYGEYIGNSGLLEAAMVQVRGVIAESYLPEEEPSIIYLIAWRKLATISKKRYQLTHNWEHFEESDKLISEAILTSSKNAELWLDWSEHFLLAGWMHRDLKLIETGLEKLTAVKVKECDPVRVSYLLGMGLITLGLFHENLKFLKEGKERIQAAVDVEPSYLPYKFALGFTELAFALYFSDIEGFARAASIFEANICENAGAVDDWYALFQTYMALGLQEGDPACVHKGLLAIQRVCELRPESSVHLNEQGVALMKVQHIESDPEKVQYNLEEAINIFRKTWTSPKITKHSIIGDARMTSLGMSQGKKSIMERRSIFYQRPSIKNRLIRTSVII